MYVWIDDPRLMESVRFKHETIYCVLLKMCTLQRSRPRASTIEKLAAFCVFCDQRLATMYAREIRIARHYFEHGQSLKLFSKMMVSGIEQIERLRGMTWDLWHVRSMEQAITLKPSSAFRYFSPALLTFDKGLIEIIDLYPLRACACSKSTGEPYAVYDGDFLADITDDRKSREDFIERFCSVSAIANRNSIRDSLKPSLHNITNALEAEFRQAARI